jgi:AcrR family transcriptional regulator
MAHGVERTRERIVDAAAAEFSAYGIAGARVDRIVARAGCGKGLVYSYFGSKEQLFDEVHHRLVTQAVDAVEFSADDLPGYAVALYDYVRANPTVIRLTAWFSLERQSRTTPAADESALRKAAAVADAQDRGAVGKAISPTVLMDMIVGLAMLGTTASADDEDRRQGVHLAVSRLVAPA